ncbi:unnamed protein product [Phytophthora lilii]|uniref:Unnamed protein product n=1 Tax=Phytophthora lilii TaxID=2077276 RepID=A0A9W6TDH7_9STRA|nr:unnamed protein product [Phytophthora lilii]
MKLPTPLLLLFVIAAVPASSFDGDFNLTTDQFRNRFTTPSPTPSSDSTSESIDTSAASSRDDTLRPSIADESASLSGSSSDSNGATSNSVDLSSDSSSKGETPVGSNEEDFSIDYFSLSGDQSGSAVPVTDESASAGSIVGSESNGVSSFPCYTSVGIEIVVIAGLKDNSTGSNGSGSNAESSSVNHESTSSGSNNGVTTSLSGDGVSSVGSNEEDYSIEYFPSSDQGISDSGSASFIINNSTSESTTDSKSAASTASTPLPVSYTSMTAGAIVGAIAALL